MLLLLAGLSTGHKIGIAVVAAIFIAFALISSFVAPKRWPDFPGRQGLSVFVIASFVLFAAMITTIVVLAVEPHEGEAHAAAGGEAKRQVIEVRESEFRIQLPPLKELHQGEYTFVVRNEGKTQHDLVVEGPHVTGEGRTPVIEPGGEARLEVGLSTGDYTLYCSVDGHRRLGMTAKILVG